MKLLGSYLQLGSEKMAAVKLVFKTTTTLYVSFIVENSDGLLNQVPPRPFPDVPQDNELDNPFDSKSPL
jgi:hypothetical protein